MRNYSPANDYITDDAVFEMIDTNDASLTNKVAAGPTTPWCIAGAAITGASAYLADACPTRGCTHSC